MWTIVNRNEYDVEGPQIEFTAEEGVRYFDLYHGAELTPAKMRGQGRAQLRHRGARTTERCWRSNRRPTPAYQALMTKMKAIAAQAAGELFARVESSAATIVPIAATKAASGSPAGMVKIPARHFLFRVHGIEIEGFNDIGVDVQYPWEDRRGASTSTPCT